MASLRSRISIALVTVAMVAAIGPQVASASTVFRIVDDDGLASPGNCAGNGMAFVEIQAAIDDSSAGTVVQVCPGTYTETLYVGPGLDGLTIEAATAVRPTIRAPRNIPAAEPAVIKLEGVQGIVLDHLRITPRGGGGSCSSDPLRLVYVLQSSVTISGSKLVAVQPYNGECGSYVWGVYVFPTASLTPMERVDVIDTTIRDFGFAGILVAEPSLDLVVRDSSFASEHVTGAIGIRQLGDVAGSLLAVRDSRFVTDPDVGPMSAIEAFSGGPARIRANVMQRVSYGVYLSQIEDGTIRDNIMVGARPDGPAAGSGITLTNDTTGITVVGNDVSRFRRNGIRVESDDNTVRNNDFRGNAGTDCVDTPSATGNTWTGNLGHESSPVGICDMP